MLNSTIGGCIPSANENNVRTRTAREELRNTWMEEDVERYRNEERLREKTEEIFRDTKYGTMNEQLWELLKEKDCRRKLYVKALKMFGRKDGMEVYRRIRDELL